LHPFQLAEQLQKGTKDLKELAGLKQTAATIHRLNSSIAELARDINSLEDELSKTGSSKTASQVKDELDEVSAKMLVNRTRHALFAQTQPQT
jgi:outer membrane murein-binding lipoprotein Lpp